MGELHTIERRTEPFDAREPQLYAQHLSLPIRREHRAAAVPRLVSFRVRQARQQRLFAEQCYSGRRQQDRKYRAWGGRHLLLPLL